MEVNVSLRGTRYVDRRVMEGQVSRICSYRHWRCVFDGNGFAGRIIRDLGKASG